jgi:Ca2+/Na+ antiporter
VFIVYQLAVVIAAVAQHQSPLALGNIIGSVISNVLAAFSLGLLFQPGHVKFDGSSKVYVTLLLVLALPVTILGYFGKGGVVFGSILIVAFGLYVVSIGVAIIKGVLAPPEAEDSSDDDRDIDSNSNSRGPSPMRHEGNGEDISNENGVSVADISPSTPPSRALRRHHRRLRTHLFQLILGFLALSLSGYILSHSATSIASELNISGTVYGITILAFATTLPEKFIAVIGASRGHSGIVVANTAGSNIFLLTLCLGVVYVNSNEAGTITLFELAVALASIVAFVVNVFFGARRWMGVVLVLGYIAFFVLEFTVFRR